LQTAALLQLLYSLLEKPPSPKLCWELGCCDVAETWASEGQASLLPLAWTDAWE
jgi:hypothetical protein